MKKKYEAPKVKVVKLPAALSEERATSVSVAK